MKRPFLLVSIAAVSAMLLAACGGGASKPGSIQNLFGSVDKASNVQLTLSGSFAGAGSAKAEAVLKAISVQLNVSNPNGGSLAKGTSSTNFEVIFNVNSHAAIDIRKVGSNAYLLANLTAFSNFPGIPAKDQGELSAANALFGGKWFKLPGSLAKSLAGNVHSSSVQNLQNVSQEKAAVAAIVRWVDGLHHKTLSNGYEVSSSLQTAVTSLYGQLHALYPSISAPTTSVAGSFSFTIKGSGSTARSMTLVVTAPNKNLGMATATVQLGISHNGTAVSAPAHATLVTPQLLHELESGG